MSTGRTDTDNWDITTSVGQTALFVAASRALEARKADPLAVDKYAEVFCRRIGASGRPRSRAPTPSIRCRPSSARTSSISGRPHEVLRRVLHPGHRGRGAAGGAAGGEPGLPGLPATVGRRHRGVRAGPAPGARIKRDTIAELDETPTAERREIAVDLRDDWPRALQENGFDPSRPSAWIAEDC